MLIIDRTGMPDRLMELSDLEVACIVAMVHLIEEGGRPAKTEEIMNFVNNTWAENYSEEMISQTLHDLADKGLLIKPPSKVDAMVFAIEQAFEELDDDFDCLDDTPKPTIH